MNATHASKIHTRANQPSRYIQPTNFTPGQVLSKYAQKQLTDEERYQYHKHLSQQEKTLYGSNGVRVEIYRHAGRWMVAGYDPDDYQDSSDDRAEAWEDALLIGEEMIMDLEDMYSDSYEDEDEWDA